MSDETLIYLSMKKWLVQNKWIIIGGEPPGGTNDIPIIELKDINYTKKGSKGSKKIDLIGYKIGYFLLVELKSTFSYGDIKKLNEIISEYKWRAAFIRALKERGILETLQISPEKEVQYLSSSKYYIKSVGFKYTGKLGPEDFVTFLFFDQKVDVKIGEKITNEVRQLFEQ